MALEELGFWECRGFGGFGSLGVFRFFEVRLTVFRGLAVKGFRDQLGF